MSQKTALALTLGNPSGIGPELALKAWVQRAQLRRPFFLMADSDHLAALAQKLQLDVPLARCTPGEAHCLFKNALPVVPLKNPVIGLPGKPVTADAAATLESIETGVELVHQGRASALVTNPISKAALYEAGFSHPGHTEFLGELALRTFGIKAQPVMMLWSPELAVVPVTIHVALAQVPKLLTTARIVYTALIV